MQKLSFEIAQLIYKYKMGILTEQVEMERILDWISSSPQNEALFTKLVSPGSITDFSKQLNRIDIDVSWRNFLLEKKRRRHRYIRIMCMKYAAITIIVLSISIGGYWWLTSDSLSDQSSFISATVQSNHILPGKTQAILTLQSGKQIELKEDETLLADQVVTYAKNTDVVAETREMIYSTIETPAGGEYRLMLSDKSFICLNCQTKLRFPDKFADNKREIELLQGEIYLDVNSSLKPPFFVKTKGLTVKVTGTSFNISTYDNIYQTTLVEGVVEISFDTGKTYTLKPSEQLSFEPETNRMHINNVDTDQYTSWVDGRISFKDETIENILNKLSRWYNFSVIYDNPSLKKYRFGLHVNKYNNVDALLAVLKSTGKLHFELNGRTIYVKGGN